jgi:transposase, IS5 family
MIYKKKNTQKGIFDEAEKMESLDSYRDPLSKISSVIDFELFREELEALAGFKIRDPKKGGRPAYDVVLMMKVLVIQHLYNLSDDETEFQVFDRLSFTRFLGLGFNDDVPDAKTIWLFKNRLGADGAKRLFELLNKALEKQRLILNKGIMVDATIVEVPRQRNSREENREIKEGKVPEKWQDNPNKLRQKDTDAKWVKKNGQNYFGYKNHIKVDEKSKLVRSYEVTDASVHDSQVLDALLDSKDKNQRLHADSAYRSDKIEKELRKKKITSRIHEKGHRGAPMTKAVKKRNTQRSKVRARVEHVFEPCKHQCGGYMQNQEQGHHTIKIGFVNLTYNLLRLTALKPEVRLVG